MTFPEYELNGHKSDRKSTHLRLFDVTSNTSILFRNWLNVTHLFANMVDAL